MTDDHSILKEINFKERLDLKSPYGEYLKRKEWLERIEKGRARFVEDITIKKAIESHDPVYGAVAEMELRDQGVNVAESLDILSLRMSIPDKDKEAYKFFIDLYERIERYAAAGLFHYEDFYASRLDKLRVMCSMWEQYDMTADIATKIFNGSGKREDEKQRILGILNSYENVMEEASYDNHKKVFRYGIGPSVRKRGSFSDTLFFEIHAVESAASLYKANALFLCNILSIYGDVYYTFFPKEVRRVFAGAFLPDRKREGSVAIYDRGYQAIPLKYYKSEYNRRKALKERISISDKERAIIPDINEIEVKDEDRVKAYHKYQKYIVYGREE